MRLQSSTFEIARVFSAAVSDVLGVLGVCAKWPATTRKGFAGGDYRRRCDPFFDPIDHRAKHIELIEPETSSAVRHSRDEIELAPS